MPDNLEASQTREELKKKLLEYQAGNIKGLENFTDAEPGEMDDFQIRIAIFGQTGTGKSALINTIYKVLLSPNELPEEGEVAIVQSAGGEGTSILEEFFQDRGFTVVDTRGFFDIDNELEETEFFRILYGTVKEGEVIDRKGRGESQTARAGKGGHKLNKAPLSQQVHVVLWVIKGDDIRLLNEEYQQKLNFVLHRLKRESITLLTVITHSDRIDSSKVQEIISKSREVTQSLDCHTFLIHNWVAGMSRLDKETEDNVLKMLNTALECGERSVKIRQTKRKAEEIKAEKLEEPEIERSKAKTHRDALAQSRTPYGKVQEAAPQEYGATKQDPPSEVPYTQLEDVPMTRRFYRASISYGRVVEVLMSDPPGWKPDASDLNDLLVKHRSEKKATIEFWDEGDGRGLRNVVHPSKAKLYKIAEGITTGKMHSVLVYSYRNHGEERINDEVSNFIHHVGVPVLLPYQTIEPASLMTDIKNAKPGYVMVSAHTDELKDEGEVQRVIREHGAQIRRVIENCVGKGVIILLFGDKYYKPGELASEEATQYVKMLTQDIIKPDRLTVMTCKERPYITHQNWMKERLKKQHYYKAVIESGQITKVLEHIPPDWIPDEVMVRKVLEENKEMERKAYLEILGNEQGEILQITVEKESRAAYYSRKLMPNVNEN